MYIPKEIASNFGHAETLAENSPMPKKIHSSLALGMVFTNMILV